jgi:hypothetical protein
MDDNKTKGLSEAMERSLISGEITMLKISQSLHAYSVPSSQTDQRSHQHPSFIKRKDG